MKEESRKATIPTIQLGFLPSAALPTIYLDQHHLSFFNIYEMLQTDSQNGSISPLPPLPSQLQPVFSRVTLYQHSC